MLLQQLSLAKSCGLIGYSVSLWFVGVISVKYLGQYLFNTNLTRMLTMAATLPMSFVTVRTVDILFSLGAAERLTAMTLACTVALVLDGTAFTFCPGIYENPLMKKVNPQSANIISRAGAGWLLYTFGMCFAIVLLT